MLIDLHAHAPLPGYYNQDPHWGPFFEKFILQEPLWQRTRQCPLPLHCI